MPRLDTKNPVPRYYQIYNALLKQMRSGELKVGEALPPERTIAKHYGVARLTVVKALDLLMRDGLIDKQQGRGSFVLPSPSVVIADEATSALDVVVQRVVAQTMLKVKEMLGVSMIMIGHDMGLMA
jgi:DNA-binding GntR family transcriptional regulator